MKLFLCVVLTGLLGFFIGHEHRDHHAQIDALKSQLNSYQNMPKVSTGYWL